LPVSFPVQIIYRIVSYLNSAIKPKIRNRGSGELCW